MLGGTPVLVSLEVEDQSSHFKDSETITCIFDEAMVTGVFVDEKSVLCVSPALSRTGRVPFQILVKRAVDFTAEATFISGMLLNNTEYCIYISS